VYQSSLQRRFSPCFLWRSLVILVLGVFLAAASADVAQKAAAEPEHRHLWYTITIDQKHCGYLHTVERPLPAPEGLERSEIGLRLVMSMTRGAQAVPLSVAGTIRMKGKDTLEDLELTVRLSDDPIKVRGREKEGQYHLDIAMRGQTQTITLPKDSALLAEQQWLTMLDPETMEIGKSVNLALGQGVDLQVTYLGRQPLTILGKTKEYPAFEIRMGLLGNLPTRMWMEGEDLIRMESNYGAFALVIERSDEAAATADLKSPEIFHGSLHRIPNAPPANEVGAFVFKLGSQWDQPLPEPPELPGRQSVLRREDGAWEVTVQRKPLPERFPLAKVQTKDRERYLQPGLFLQSDDQSIKKTAREVVGKEKDAVVICRRLRDWVHERVEGSFSVGFGSATEVLERGTGDCTEYSVLLVSLLRAAGLPARTATGLALLSEEKLMGGHMWVEVYLDQWYPLDAALDMAKTDPGYVKLGEGVTPAQEGEAGVQDLLRSSALTLGAKIELLRWTPRKPSGKAGE
jgi:hypothetical protein